MALQLSFPSLFLVSTLVGLLSSKLTSFTTVQTFLWSFLALIPSYYILYESWIFPLYISPNRKIPTVPGFPLWGQTHRIITEEVGVPQREWHQQYGPIIRYFLPFGCERLSVVEDKALTHMTVKNPYNFPKPVRAKDWMVRVLGDGVLLAEGDAHVHQRKALSPGFSITSIRALAPVFWQKSLLLSQLWTQDMVHENVKSMSIEVLEWLNRTTLDIIGEAGFGANIDSLRNPETPLRNAYRAVFSFDPMARLFHGLQAYTSYARYLPFQLNRDMTSSRNIILRVANDIVRSKERRSEIKESREKDIIGLIIRDNMKVDPNNEDKLSFETMRDQVMTFLGAGHDTTATGVAWTLHLIAKHPDVQARLRAEIKQYMPFLWDPAARADQTKILAADVDQLPYMENVCRESLRYIPPIPFTTRTTVVDDHLCGFEIPANTTIYIFSNTINRLPQYWGETADTFDPERWNKLPDTYTTNAYMTFLHGPRGCIGKKFAETEMKSLLCCLLSMYEFGIDDQVVDPEQWKMWRLVLRPRDGITLKVSKLAEANGHVKA
ncbi:hypothetical protein MMC20_005384 [Loxospora ochrophaea]|nr:hypothetical protein [Loxospora ochrophaea]